MEILKVEKTMHAKGILVIPKILRDGLNIKEGDKVMIILTDEKKMEIRKAKENGS